MESTAILKDGFKSTVDNGRSHTIITDLPKASGGEDSGASALEVALMSLAGCVTTIFALVAKNSHVEFQDIQVKAKSDKPDSGKTFEHVQLLVSVHSPREKEKIEQVLNKTIKICPVGLIYDKAGITFDISLEVTQ